MGVNQVGNGKIVSIDTLRSRAAAQRRLAEAGRESAQPHGPDAESQGAHDTLQLSDQAKALLDREQMMAGLRSELKDLPDVRVDKVIEARLRLTSGYYDRPEVKEEIARAFLSDFRPPKDAPVEP